MKRRAVNITRAAFVVILTAILAFSVILALTGCAAEASTYTIQDDIEVQQDITNGMISHQHTPRDIDYSLERYNLIRRAYWVNGQREKANTLPCMIEKPLGYIVLFSGDTLVGRFVVDGKVSSLNSFLTPSTVDDIRGTSSGGYTTVTTELADVDGSYGENDNGIFFFTPSGNYIEWTGKYLYSDIPFEIADPVVTYEVAE